MTHDVIIAGAGPVGLFLACELRLAGISVLVLEQSENPHSPLKALPFGMRGLWTPTIEALNRRGLLHDIAGTQPANTQQYIASTGARNPQQQRREAGHFAGIPFDFDNINTAQWPYHLNTTTPTSIATDLAHIEAALAARADALGVAIKRGTGVEHIEQSDDTVTVHAGGETFQSRWLVGCDGGRSVVRKSGGFEFVGTEPEFTGYSVQVDIADADASKLSLGRHYTATGMFMQARLGTIRMVEFDGGALHRSQPITLEHVQSVLRRVSGTDVTLTALHVATTWTDRAFQATTYRNGRVLLAGDSAHIHSPLGGQGLNLGFGDAMNLGWKLAATVRGDAADGLLNTYTSERHGVGAQVLDWSRAQVLLMRPGQSSRALESVVRDLINTRDGATYFAERVWGMLVRYDMGDAHPLVGRSAPDFELADGRTVGELLRNGKGLLLDFDARVQLQSLAHRWHDRITYVAGNAKERLGLSAVLVRPDGFGAWACDGEPNVDEAARAVARWFGTRALSD